MICIFCGRATVFIEDSWDDQDGGSTTLLYCDHCGGAWSSTIEITSAPDMTVCPGCGEEIVVKDAYSPDGRFGCPECGYTEEVPDAE